MPKVLIREYDKSTTGIPASDNFAVVVPGFFGEPGKDDKTGEPLDPTKLLIDYDVYEVKSQQDFEAYIGKYSSEVQAAVAPTLEVLNPPNATNGYNAYTQYLKALTPADFERYQDADNDEYIYQARVITDSTDPTYGKNGYLHTTISYKEKTKEPILDENGEVQYKTDAEGELELDEDGKPISLTHWVEADTETTVTIKLEKVSIANVRWSLNGASPISEDSNYCIIRRGFEGSSAIQTPHMGNQIAYELLGLGYTVLFKKMTSTDELNTAAFWEPLKDKSVFNFRYVMTGGYYSASAMNQICALAKFNNTATLEEAETYGNLSGRGDCIALCDIDEDIPEHSINSSLSMRTLIENMGYAAGCIQSNEYSAIFGPKVTYVMEFPENSIYQTKTFPCSFHYLACAARTFGRYNEWYAVAGYNRGISNYTIQTTSVKLGEIAINTLAPRIANDYTTKSINLVLHEKGNYYLWGNRTGYALDNKGIVFHHFLNIRQLCCSIKKQLYTACRQFTFDPNSDLLWINFVNAIKPTLEAMKADQGVKGYTITRIANDKKALLTARIRIVPIEAVEDFDISIYLEDSLTGIVVNASEAQA